MELTLSVPTPQEAHILSEVLFPLFKQHRVFCFHGELGAGKTTFIKQVCADLGVKEGISSPSFSIVNEYVRDNGDVIYHFDLYRLKTPRELLDIGWEDYLGSDRLTLVEWPEMAAELMPDDAVHVYVSVEGQKRHIVINHEQ